MNLDKLYKVLADQKKYRVKQCQEAIFSNFLSDWSQASNLPKSLVEKLNAECPLQIEAQIFKSKDNKTSKALITLEDGLQIETVLLSHRDGRHTVCVSTEVGCPMGCTFCATGKMGLKRNLTYSEIVDQVLIFSRILHQTGERVSNVVFMGMGEPFLNYDHVMKSIKYLNDKEAFNIGARHISISTCGILTGIDKFANEKMQINLAISLHAPNDELRTQLMPINRRFPLDKLFKTIDKYINKTGRKVMFEYLMIKGVNDRPEHARQLSKLMAKPLYMVNLIPYNPTDVYKPSDSKTIQNFKNILDKAGIEVVQRYSFGQDIKAACGQLAITKKE
ncbi:MAG: rRNA (adenine2503-C2)-methyltransferase [Patescibacteria group bacterium]|nr:rRNA (adenine2503-C2)-methyltransferase [Patescibacteria group bacterium]